MKSTLKKTLFVAALLGTITTVGSNTTTYAAKNSRSIRTVQVKKTVKPSRRIAQQIKRVALKKAQLQRKTAAKKATITKAKARAKAKAKGKLKAKAKLKAKQAAIQAKQQLKKETQQIKQAQGKTASLNGQQVLHSDPNTGAKVVLSTDAIKALTTQQNTFKVMKTMVLSNGVVFYEVTNDQYRGWVTGGTVADQSTTGLTLTADTNNNGNSDNSGNTDNNGSNTNNGGNDTNNSGNSNNNGNNNSTQPTITPIKPVSDYGQDSTDIHWSGDGSSDPNYNVNTRNNTVEILYNYDNRNVALLFFKPDNADNLKMGDALTNQDTMNGKNLAQTVADNTPYTYHIQSEFNTSQAKVGDIIKVDLAMDTSDVYHLQVENDTINGINFNYQDIQNEDSDELAAVNPISEAQLTDADKGLSFDPSQEDSDSDSDNNDYGSMLSAITKDIFNAQLPNDVADFPKTTSEVDLTAASVKALAGQPYVTGTKTFTDSNGQQYHYIYVLEKDPNGETADNPGHLMDYGGGTMALQGVVSLPVVGAAPTTTYNAEPILSKIITLM